MSQVRRRQLQWRLQQLRRAAHRDRSLSWRPHLNPSRRQPRHHPRHPRQVNRDLECRAVVAAAGVVAEAVRGRERLRPRPQSRQKLRRQEHPR